MSEERAGKARRSRGETVEVELVPDDGEGGPGTPAAVDGHRTGGRRWPAWWGRLSRRTQAVVGAAAVAVVLVPLGTVAALDSAADRERAARMPGLPGGVADLSVAPEPGWEVATDEGVLSVLPDGGILTRAGTDVLALDAATGAERWRHELGMLAECGPAGGAVEAGDPVVCLAGPPDDRTVTVLGVDGAVLGTRGLGAVESAGTQVPGVGSVAGYDGERFRWSLPSVWPAADGALVVLDPGEGMVQAADADEARRALAALRPDDLPELRVVDARSGEVRGAATPSLRTTADLAGCQDSVAGWLVDLEQPYTWVSGGLASMSVCGTPTVLTTGGEQVDGVPAPVTGRTWSLDDGLVVATETGATVVRGGEDGNVDLPGVPLPVLADVDPSDVVVAVAPDGSVVGAAPDGTGRWTASLDADAWSRQQLARAGGTTVMTGADGDLVGLDLATGQERWRRDDVLPTDEETDQRVVGALTDGRTVVLGVRRADGYDLVALDAVSGRTVWESGHDGRPLADLRAVDGHVVAVLQDRSPSVRVGGDGEPGVATSDTVLRGLATG
ncbi:PQQ-binding-like beta-propeller repeat protein [Isoptericola sp. BMS4]|uniref:PQQ-binding-like beta-propeller repeat protein n=1 Tax=Isoptericola sp. BMS4 TaxID=2527875 RepID=UPI00141FDA2F|nr:PQQ-binding-like beta-propeller repeat protein [Isoptericola sp. BMS4]